MANRELETIDEEIRKEKEKYLESTAKSIKHKSKKAGSLLRAAHKGKESKIVALLTKEGIDINCKDVEREETPLHFAATAGHNTVLDYLLVKGANVNLVNAKGQNAVHKATYFDSHEIIRTLSSYGADLNAEDSDGMTPLFLALSRNAHNSVAALIHCGADFKMLGGKSKTLIVLHEASSRGFVKAVKAICERCEPDYINLQNPVGNTALHIAVLNARTGVIALLLGYKISTQIRNSNGFTAADLATTSGFHEIASVIAKSSEQKSAVAPPAIPAEVIPVQTSQACQGYLLILSENKKKWSKHYFQIRDGLLFEYERQGGEQVNVHNLFGSTLQLLQNANLPYCFEISSASTTRIVLKAFTNEELNSWTKDIQNHANPEKTLKASKVTNRISAANNQTVDTEIRKYNESMSKATITGDSWDSVMQNFSTHAQSLEVEYEWILLEEREMSKSQTLCSDAMQPGNRRKNRYNNFLPYNSTRVPLSEIPGVEGSDYINANYITFEGNTFIATQAPLPHTVEDFYKMIWEHCSPVIVMLTPFNEGTRVTAHEYLPKPNRPVEMETYPIRISLLEQQAYPFYTLSILSFELLQKTGQDDTFVVKHYHCNKWNDNKAVDATALLEIVEQVREVAKSHPEYPITVHCSSGMSQTGVWIFISGYLQRIETFLLNSTMPVLNVMQAIELLRSQRTGLLTHMDQYQFIYQFVLSQLELIGRRKNSQVSALPPPLWNPPSMDLLPDLPPPPPEPLEVPSIHPSLITAVPAATMRRSIMITNSPKSTKKSLRGESAAPVPSGSVSKTTSAAFGVNASEPSRPPTLPRSNTVSSPPSLPARDDSVPVPLPSREEIPPPLTRKPSSNHMQNIPSPILPSREEIPPPLTRKLSSSHMQIPPHIPSPILPSREEPPPLTRKPSSSQMQTPPPILPSREEIPPPLTRKPSSNHMQNSPIPSPILPPREEPPPLTRKPSSSQMQTPPPIPAREETSTPTLPPREDPPVPIVPAREDSKPTPVRPFGQAQLRSSGQRSFREDRSVSTPLPVELNSPSLPSREDSLRSPKTLPPSIVKNPSLPPRDEPPPPLTRQPSESKILVKKPSDNKLQPPVTPPRDEPQPQTPNRITKTTSDNNIPATPPREDTKPSTLTRAPSDNKLQPAKEEPPWKLNKVDKAPAMPPRDEPAKPPPSTPSRDEPPQSQPRLTKAPSDNKITPKEDSQPRFLKTSIDKPPSTPTKVDSKPPPTAPREEPPRVTKQPSSSDIKPPVTPPRDDTKAPENKPPQDTRIARVPSDNKLGNTGEKQTKPPAEKPQPKSQNSFTVQSNPFLAKDKTTQPPSSVPPKPQPKAEEPKQPAPIQPSPPEIHATKVPTQAVTTKQEFSLLEWLQGIEMEHLVDPLTELGADKLKNLEILTAEDLGEVPNLKPLEKKRLLLEIGKLLKAK